MGQFRANFHLVGDFPANYFCTDRYRPVNALQPCRWHVVGYSQKNFVADFLQLKWSANLHGKRPFWVLSFLGGLGATYDVHFRLIGMRGVDFLLVLIELFFARCCGWGATSKYRLKIGIFAPTGSVYPKISRRRGCLHQTGPPVIPFLKTQNSPPPTKKLGYRYR